MFGRPEGGTFADGVSRVAYSDADVGGRQYVMDLMRAALRRADPEAVAVPMMITPGTDAKALASLGIPTYGFCPLRLDADTPFLDVFHGHDERVPADAIRFGVPVLEEVVRAFTAAEAG